MKSITDAELDAMFEHYLDIIRRSHKCTSGSEDDIYYTGEMSECERWLKLFGVDTSYKRIARLLGEI